MFKAGQKVRVDFINYLPLIPVPYHGILQDMDSATVVNCYEHWVELALHFYKGGAKKDSVKLTLPRSAISRLKKRMTHPATRIFMDDDE